VRPRAAATAFAAATLLAVVITPMTAAHAADQPAHGLRGDYYTGQFESLKATVVDPQLDFGDLEPTLAGLTGQNDHDTVRWTGRIQPPSSDTYTFSMVSSSTTGSTTGTTRRPARRSRWTPAGSTISRSSTSRTSAARTCT
jgi:hypothetical protein